MEETTKDNNKVIEENAEIFTYNHSYNFISIPWDDRSKKSKLLIIILLLAIFITTIALVINNFVVYYRNFKFSESIKTGEINCNLVKVDEYNYVARIHSVSSRELICIGAVIGENLVIANEVCLKSGPVRLHMGSPTDLRCKNGFSINSVEFIPRDGVMSKSFVLISTYKNIIGCANVIRLSSKNNRQSHAYIIGRPFHGERSLSRQIVTFDVPDNYTAINNLNDSHVICVKYLSRCPVRAGDLLVQSNRLLGLASTKIMHQEDVNKKACFANISNIYPDLTLRNVEIDSE